MKKTYGWAVKEIDLYKTPIDLSEPNANSIFEIKEKVNEIIKALTPVKRRTPCRKIR